MARPIRMNHAPDGADLQALFDSIAVAAVPAEPAPEAQRDISGDSDELQALFDSIAAQVADA
jgi:chemotaxis protein CheZ